MDDLQKKRYLREKKKKAQLEEDLRPELLLRVEMELTKRKLHEGAPTFERVRGYVQLEDDPDAKDGPNRTTDYQLNIRFNEASAKTLKNKDNRLDPGYLGILIYGKSLHDKDGSIHPMIKEALKCARTLLAEKKEMRTIESITEEEISMLEDKYIGQDLPTGARV